MLHQLPTLWLCLIGSLLPAMSLQSGRPASKPADSPPTPTRQGTPRTQASTEKLVNPRHFEQEGHLDAAIEAWRTWARLKPRDPLPYREVLRLSLLQQKPLLGIQFAEKGQELFPKDLPLMMGMATAHMRLAELIAAGLDVDRDLRTILEEAEFQAESALEAAPRKREALAVLAMAQFRLGRNEDARETAKTLSKEHAGHYSGPVLLGDIAFRLYKIAKRDQGEPKEIFGFLGEARQAYMEAIRRAPEKAQPYRMLGVISWLRKKQVQSLKWFVEGLARDPRQGAPIGWIDKELDPFKRMDLYIKAAKRYAELSTKPVRDRALLLQKAAVAAFEVQNWKLCKSLAQEAYKMDPSWKDGLYSFAISSFNLSDKDGAMTAMGLYAVEAPKWLDARLRAGTREQSRDLTDKLVILADKAYRKGQFQASRAMNRALADYLDDSESWNNYAFLCRETRSFEESYRAYQKALEKAPTDPRLLNDTAVILQYHLHRDLDKARKMYEEAILQAKRILRDRSSDKVRKKDARQAISDAKGNLRVLKKGPPKKPKK